ncbi:MAG: hypothetical protein LZF60_20145 [Nitrospira sp.]|nr:hypothetical protein [Nitrospira sp.]ULA58096.1 MAG: hypothetical protein LZF60_20145 [Nitrospira sp.]
MAVFSSGFVSRQAQNIRQGLRHAFALRAEQQAFTAEELMLLERIAEAIVARRMTAPAMLFLESMGPMNFLGSQALHFLAPLVECVFSGSELAQIARLLERRDSLQRLTALIEAKAAASVGAPAR